MHKVVEVLPYGEDASAYLNDEIVVMVAEDHDDGTEDEVGDCHHT